MKWREKIMICDLCSSNNPDMGTTFFWWHAFIIKIQDYVTKSMKSELNAIQQRTNYYKIV